MSRAVNPVRPERYRPVPPLTNNQRQQVQRPPEHHKLRRPGASPGAGRYSSDGDGSGRACRRCLEGSRSPVRGWGCKSSCLRGSFSRGVSSMAERRFDTAETAERNRHLAPVFFVLSTTPGWLTANSRAAPLRTGEPWGCKSSPRQVERTSLHAPLSQQLRSRSSKPDKSGQHRHGAPLFQFIHRFVSKPADEPS